MTNWLQVQEAVSQFGADSPEAAEAMREYRAGQTARSDHATPDEVWTPGTRTTAWDRVSA